MSPLARSKFEKDLAEKHACYVLITCDQAIEGEKEMEVKFSYCGDKYLASYLIEGAQSYLTDQICEEDEELN